MLGLLRPLRPLLPCHFSSASSPSSPALLLVLLMGGVFAKYSVQAVAWLFSKKSVLFFGISRFKKIDTVS